MRIFRFIPIAIMIVAIPMWAQVAYESNVSDGEHNITSTTYEDLSGMSLTFTTEADQQVFVVFSTDYVHCTSLGQTYIHYRFVRDGEPLGDVVGCLDRSSEGGSLCYNFFLQQLDKPGAGTHTYKVQVKVESNQAQYAGRRVITALVLTPPPAAVAESPATLPESELLLWASPNHFSAKTQIHYFLPNSGWVNLKIIDETGCIVRTLVSAGQQSSSYVVTWDGKDDQGLTVPTGTYFCLLETPFSKQEAKIVAVH